MQVNMLKILALIVYLCLCLQLLHFIANVHVISTAGPANLNFTNIVLNNGALWNASTASTRIPINGFYYVKLSAVAPENFKFKLILQVVNKYNNLLSVEDENVANDTRQVIDY